MQVWFRLCFCYTFVSTFYSNDQPPKPLESMKIVLFFRHFNKFRTLQVMLHPLPICIADWLHICLTNKHRFKNKSKSKSICWLSCSSICYRFEFHCWTILGGLGAYQNGSSAVGANKRSLVIFVYFKNIIEIITKCNPYNRCSRLVGMSVFMFLQDVSYCLPCAPTKRSNVSQTPLKTSPTLASFLSMNSP